MLIVKNTKKKVVLYFMACLLFPSGILSAEEKETSTGTSTLFQYQAKHILAPFEIALRIVSGIEFGSTVFSPDFQSYTINDVKIPTEIGELNINSIRTHNIKGPFTEPRSYRVAYELLGVRYDIDPDYAPPEFFQVSENVGLSSIESDIVLTLEYDFKKSNLKSSGLIDIKGVGELELEAELLNIRLDKDYSIQSIAKGRMDYSAELMAELKFLKFRIEDKGLKEKMITFVATTEDKRISTVRRDFHSTMAQKMKEVIPNTGNEDIDKILSNAIVEIKKLLKRGGGITASITPEEPMLVQELPDAIEDMELKFLDFKIKHDKEKAYNDLIFGKNAYKSALENDNKEYQELAIQYLKGVGVPQNFAKGLKLLKNKKLNMDSDTNFTLGSIYFKGIGTKKDVNKGYKHSLLAAALGHPGSIALANEIEKFIKPDKIKHLQLEVLEFWLEKRRYKEKINSAHKGNISDIRRLALNFRSGDNFPRNYFESYVWSIIGTALGDKISENLRDAYWSAARKGKIITSQEISKAQEKAELIWNTSISKQLMESN